MENMSPVFISVKEAMRISGISKPKMYEICKRIDVDFIVQQGDKNGKYLIHRERFLNWLNQINKL